MPNVPRSPIGHPRAAFLDAKNFERNREAMCANETTRGARGHAIECRINGDDPAQGFRPSPGILKSFEIATDKGPGTIRVDTHLAAGDEVTPYYDSLVAKVIAHAPTRDKAIETMLRALASAKIEGIATTIQLHLEVLVSEEFRSGKYDTSRIPAWSSQVGPRTR